MSSDRSTLPRRGSLHRRTAVTSAAFALAACTVLTACDGSSGGSSPTVNSSAPDTSASIQSTDAGATPSSGDTGSSTASARPTTSPTSQTPSAQSSSRGTTKTPYRPTSSAPAPTSTGTWRDSYHPLPSSATVPSKAKLTFGSIEFNALDGGWNLTAVVTYPGAQRAPLLYFALQSGTSAPGPAAPFQLKSGQDVHVFIGGDQKPTPTKVVVYAARANNAQGRTLLTVAIPGSAVAG